MENDTGNGELVVFVHGLWMPGHEMTLLRRHVRRCGFRTVQFSYPSVHRTVAENAATLDRFLRSQSGCTIHLVAHSLGGLVVRRLLHDFPDQRPGRIVTLGTPHDGSHVARVLSRSAFGRSILGGSLQGGLLGDVPLWPGDHELGVIVGTRNVGISRLITRLPGRSDGVVAVGEAHLPDASDCIEVDAVHLGLLFSRVAAQQTCNFLKNGSFIHGNHADRLAGGR